MSSPSRWRCRSGTSIARRSTRSSTAMARRRTVEAVSRRCRGKDPGARARLATGDSSPRNGNVSPEGMLVARAADHVRRRTNRNRAAARDAASTSSSELRGSLDSMARHHAGDRCAADPLPSISFSGAPWCGRSTEIEKYAVAVSSGASDAPSRSRRFPEESWRAFTPSIETMVRLLEERYGQLKESGERFRSIFDAVNDAIVINDIDSGAILDANAAMCAMFGYTVEELRSIGIGPLSAGDLSFTAADALVRIRKAAAGEKQLFEWHSRHKDGHLFWTEVNLHVATIGDSRRSIVVVRDITQRKQMEEALKEEKDFTDTAINAMTGIFFVQDRQGRFVRWNDAMEQLAARAGRTVEESGGGVLVHPDDRELVAEKIEEVFDRGYAEIEARIVLGDEIRYFFLNARRMDVDGEQFLVGTGFDVTERRRAEAEQKRLQNAVERSAAEWKETFDTVTTPILIMERSGAVVRVNRAALELSGLSEAEISGLSDRCDRRWRAVADRIAARLVHRRRAAGDDRRNEGCRRQDVGHHHHAFFRSGRRRRALHPRAVGDHRHRRAAGIAAAQRDAVGDGHARGRRRARGPQSALRHLGHARCISRGDEPARLRRMRRHAAAGGEPARAPDAGAARVRQAGGAFDRARRCQRGGRRSRGEPPLRRARRAGRDPERDDGEHAGAADGSVAAAAGVREPDRQRHPAFRSRHDRAHRRQRRRSRRAAMGGVPRRR